MCFELPVVPHFAFFQLVFKGIRGHNDFPIGVLCFVFFEKLEVEHRLANTSRASDYNVLLTNIHRLYDKIGVFGIAIANEYRRKHTAMAMALRQAMRCIKNTHRRAWIWLHSRTACVNVWMMWTLNWWWMNTGNEFACSAVNCEPIVGGCEDRRTDVKAPPRVSCSTVKINLLREFHC